MKLKKGFVLRDVCGNNTVMAEGLGTINFNKLLCLNETATFLWRKAEEAGEFTEEQLAEALCQEYDTDVETARKDVGDIIAEWKRLELI
jgi:hypothetical protein